MPRLPSLNCPKCRELVVSDEYIPNARGGAVKASNFESCLRRCVRCGIGFSNRLQNVVLIYRNPMESVPDEVSQGWSEAIARALNVKNRTGKRTSCGSHNSEDAITWTVFTTLQRSGQLQHVIGSLGCLPAKNAVREPKTLLWGVPMPMDDPDANAIRDRLVQIADSLREKPRYRSEPDVVLDFGSAGVVFVEVKHRSPNETKPEDYTGWVKYTQNTPAFKDPTGIQRAGLYELARNWRFAWELAEGRPYALLNLGPTNLLASPGLDAFSQGLSQDDSRIFQRIGWQQFRAAMAPEPQWLFDFLNARNVR